MSLPDTEAPSESPVSGRARRRRPRVIRPSAAGRPARAAGAAVTAHRGIGFAVWPGRRTLANPGGNAMTAVLQSVAVGVFKDRHDAERAVEALRAAGFPDDRIGFVARNPAPPEPAPGHPGDRGVHVGVGAAAGVIAGGTIGTVAGLAVAAGMIPAVGPIIAGGILLGVLESLAAGAAVGGVIGALVGLGVPEEEASFYEGELRTGRILVTVQAGARYNDAVAILREHGAYGKGSPLI